MSSHAKLSPSSASRWKSCTASVAAHAGIDDNGGSDAARWGTTAHEIASRCLSESVDPQAFLGQFLLFLRNKATGERVESILASEISLQAEYDTYTREHRVEVTQDMVECVEKYVNDVLTLYDLLGGQLFIEKAVPIGHITGEKDATGTSDASLLTGRRLFVIDLKGGLRQVDAFYNVNGEVELNDQLAMYADGMIEKYQLRGVVDDITLMIMQPRCKHVSEITVKYDVLQAHIQGLREAAERTRNSPEFKPTSDNCHFCKARGRCKAQEDAVFGETLIDFDTKPRLKPVPTVNLGRAYELRGLVESWVSGVTSAMYRELEQGNTVQSPSGATYKLVEGKQKPAHWVDEENVLTLLELFKVPVADRFKTTLNSPAQIKKLGEPVSGGRGKPPLRLALITAEQWESISNLTHRDPPNLTITTSDDPRPKQDKNSLNDLFN
jgi:Protein of unknown function (DUF2800)